MNLSKKQLWFLVFLGISMSLLALRIDLHDFVETPWYLWPWVPICSVYPLLLALNYLYFLRFGRFPQFLLNFTVFGIIGYGIIAPIFYIFYMMESSFSWYEFGNIFWVWLYASQAFLLWPQRKQLPWWQIFLIGGYFFIKDLLDRFSVTWSYVRYGVLSENLMNIVFSLLLVIHLGLLLFFLYKQLRFHKKSLL